MVLLMLLNFLVIWIFGTIWMVNFYRIINIWIGFNKNLTLFLILYSYLLQEKLLHSLFHALVGFFHEFKEKHDLDKFKILFSTPMLHAYTFKSTHLFLMLAFNIKIKIQHTKIIKKKVRISISSI